MMPLPMRPRMPKALSIYVFLIAFLAPIAHSAPLQVSGDVVCKSTTWHDVLVFLLANFVAHTATIPQSPGIKWYISIQWCLIAFLLPFFTLSSSIGKLVEHFSRGGNDLRNALAAGAIVIVARTSKWRPDPTSVTICEARANEKIRHTVSPEPVDASMTVYDGEGMPGSAYTIYGSQRIPKGYQLFHALSDRGHDAMFEYLEHGGETTTLSKSKSWVRMGAGIAQLIFSCVTLYNARSTQIDKYGYAAFGLYVFPFIFMSIVNIVCIGFIGDYSTLYVIRTPVLLEAERRGGIFDGSVGIVEKEILEVNYGRMDRDPRNDGTYDGLFKASLKDGEDVILQSHSKERKCPLALAGTHSTRRVAYMQIPACFNNFRDKRSKNLDEDDKRTKYFVRSSFTYLSVYLVIIVGPYMALYGSTRFHQRDSTSPQRGWLISWIVCNQIAALLPIFLDLFRVLVAPSGWWTGGDWLSSNTTRIFVYLCLVPLSVPAIGGYYTLIRELVEFGSCTAV